jgi:N-acyl-D-amino-acid deacylase
MTSLSAQILGLKDRGRLAPGMKADVVVFNPVTIRDKATYFEPFQYSEGINYVLVNGSFVVDGGKPTDAKPGKVLVRQRAPVTP